MLEDPAIRNASQAPPPSNYPMYGAPGPYGPPPGPNGPGYFPGYPPYGGPPGPGMGPPPPAKGPWGPPGKKEEKEEPKNGTEKTKNRAQPGTGGFLNDKFRGGNNVKNVEDDFDFASSSAKFDKDGFARQLEKENAERAEATKEEGEIPPSNVAKKYDAKKSFFDDLSSSTSSRNIKDDPADVETFGKAAENYRSQHGRRRGGGRRRGRGRGRGRGRRGRGGRRPRRDGDGDKRAVANSNWRVKTSSE
mmetsp:Transcript_1331/g.1829  ORF Transcript_1331/g.1829 Transcript_1331/m.1829 type:complete len:248 (-) Transcript_1331:316-1059(-)